MEETAKTIAIVGAGIVGVSTAIHLQRDGHNVVLIDKSGPAEGTSFGNGGVLASAAIVPVTGPGLMRKAPRMLLDPKEPLFLRWGYVPKLMPWLLKYLSHANAKDTRRIASAVHGIVGDSLTEHLALAEGTQARRYIHPSDYLFVYNNRAKFEKEAFDWELRRAHGLEWDELNAEAFRKYDSIYALEFGFATRLRDHGRISDPGEYVKHLAQHVVQQGGRFIKAAVSDVARENGKVTGVIAGGEVIPCDAVVFATGVWSGPLMKKLGLKIPIEAERGYHLELWEPSAMPKSPVMVAAAKCVVTPMDGRIRIAGIVEFGGLDAPPSKAPVELLRHSARRVFPNLTWKHEQEWMGSRPAPTDSIPVIGEVPHMKGVYTGFGHQHIGLTGGPKTGRLLAQMISGRTPNMDMSVYAPSRYS